MMKILLPVDGSEASLEAVRHALALVATGLHAHLVLVNVQEPTYLYEMMLAPDADVLERVTGGAGRHAMEAAEALIKVSGVPYEREIASGEPAQTLVEVAQAHDCDMVVMGARGMGLVRSALLGSVSTWMVQHSPIPVTVVRQDQRAGSPDDDAEDSDRG